MLGGEGGVGGESTAKAPFEATAPCVDALTGASKAERQALGREGAQGPGQQASPGTAVASASPAQAAKKTGREGNNGSQRPGKASAKKRKRKQGLSRRRYRAAKPEWVKRAEKARLEGAAQLRAIRAVFRDGRTAEANSAQTTWSGKLVVLERTALALTRGRLAFQGREQMPGWDRGFGRHGKGWRLSSGKSQRKGVERCTFHDLNCIRAVVDWRWLHDRKGRAPLTRGDSTELAWEPGPSQLHYCRRLYQGRRVWEPFRKLLLRNSSFPCASEIEAEFHKAMNARMQAGLVDKIRAAQASEELRISMAMRKPTRKQWVRWFISTVPEPRSPGTEGEEEAVRGEDVGEGREGGQGSGEAGGSEEGSDSDMSSEGMVESDKEFHITILGEVRLLKDGFPPPLCTDEEEQLLLTRCRERLTFDFQAEIRRVIGEAEVFLPPDECPIHLPGKCPASCRPHDFWDRDHWEAAKKWVRRDGHAEALALIVARVADDLGIDHWERWFMKLPCRIAGRIFGEDYLTWACFAWLGCGVGDWTFLSENTLLPLSDYSDSE